MAAITAEQRAELVALFLTMFGQAPTTTQLARMVTARENGTSLVNIATSAATVLETEFALVASMDANSFATYLTNALLASDTPAAAREWATNWVITNVSGNKTKAQVITEAVQAIRATTNTNYASAQAELAADVTTALNGIDTNVVVGQTYTLSTNSDVLGPNSLTAVNKTTSGDDTIYANTDGALSGADIVDGGAGVDTLYSVQDVGAAESLTPVLSNVENLYIDVNDTTTGTASTFTFNGSTSTGLKQVWVNEFSGSTTGQEDTFAITNVSTAVTTGIKGGDGEFHVTTTYTGATGTNDSATLALNGAKVDTVTMASIENVNITAAAPTATGSNTIATLTVAAAKTLTITGDRGLTVTNQINFADATDTLAIDGTVDASGTTGSVSLVLDSGDNIKFTGGSGKNTVTTGAGNDELIGGAASDTFTLGAGNDKVTGNAGDDRVIVTLANLDASDSINLGDGSRDALITTATTLNSTGVDATKLALINAMAGLEVIGTSGAVTAIDAGYFNQNVFEATAALTAAVTMSNVAGDTLILGGGITTVAGDALTVTGALPNQSVTIELKGAAAVNLAGTDIAGATGLTVSSGISTVNLVSNTTGLGITNTIANAAATTAEYSIDNASAGSFVLTGSANLTISSGATAGFSKAVDFNASAFTGKLSIVGSESADIIKGGSGADTINGDDGDDFLTGNGGADTFVFVSGDGSAAPAATIFETITDYQKGSDIIDWDAALTQDEASAAATSTVAQVNAESIATFFSSDDTLAEKIVAAAKGFDADGDFAVFEHSGDTYVLISGDANGTLDAPDALIKLVGVTGVTDTTIDGNGNLLLA